MFKLRGADLLFSFFVSTPLSVLSIGHSFNGRLNIDSRLFSLPVTWSSECFVACEPVCLAGISGGREGRKWCVRRYTPVATGLLTT